MPIEQLTRTATRASAEPAQQAPSAVPARPGKYLLKSVTLQLSALLAAGYLAFWSFYPWRPLAELDIPAWMVKFASNAAHTVQTTKAQVLVMGTSLIGTPAVRFNNPRINEEALRQASASNVTCDLLAAPGAVMSDQGFIVHELFLSDKKPRLIVLTYSPREFVDNEVGDRIAITPTRRVLQFANKRLHFLPLSCSIQDMGDCLIRHQLFADLVRRHWLRVLSIEASRLTGHPLTLFDGARMQKADPAVENQPEINETTGGAGSNCGGENSPASPAGLQVDIDLYKRRYNPFNESRATVQMQYLADLLEECRNRGTEVAMVGMPLSPANLKLLPAGVYHKLNDRISKLATTYGASTYDFNLQASGQFAQDDFVDSVHLTTAGSRRFMPLFARAVTDSSAYKSAFGEKSQAQ